MDKQNKLAQLGIWLLATGIILYMILFSLWTFFYTETGNGDNVENIHITWLVAQGKVPYLDFFEHHNPLLWYLFAPFIRNFNNVLSVLDAAHAIGLLAGFATFFVTYRIMVRFFGDSLSSVISLIVLCPTFFYIFCFNYNSDTFMALFFAIGLYYLFAYFEKNNIKDLVISFASFFVSFLFSQKILVVLLFWGPLCLFTLFKKKSKLSDVLYALIIPFWGMILFIVLLYKAGALELYWKTCYLFNVTMQKYYGDHQVNVVEVKSLYFSLVLSAIGILLLFRKSNVYFKIISIVAVAEFIMRFYYFSLSPYYMLPLMIYVSCINSYAIKHILKKQFFAIMLFLAVGLYYVNINKTKYLTYRSEQRDFAKFLQINLTPCDYIISSYLGMQSIFTKDPYYYFGLLGHIDLAGEETGIFPRIDVSNIAITYKPKIVYGGVYWNSYYQNRGQQVFVQKISDDILNKYYIQSKYSEFYILRPEYRKHNCVFDKTRGTWNYAD